MSTAATVRLLDAGVSPDTHILLDSFDAGLVILDRLAVVSYMNRTAAPLLGVAELDPVGRLLWEVAAPTAAGRVREAFDRCITEHDPVDVTYTVVTGHVRRWITARLSASAGSVAISVHELTAGHGTRPDRRFIQQQLKQLLNSTSLATVTTDLTGVVTSLGGGLADELGWDAATLLGLSGDEMVHRLTDHPTAAAALLLGRVLAGDTIEGSARVGNRLVRYVSAPLLDDDDATVGTHTVLTDVTAEYELSRAQTAMAVIRRAALAEPDISRFMHKALRVLATTDRVSVLAYTTSDAAGDEIIRVGRGWGEAVTGRVLFRAGEKGTSRAQHILRAEGFHVVELTEDDVVATGRDRRRFVSGLAAAVRIKEAVCGKLVVLSTRERDFTLNEKCFLGAVADVIAAAIDRHQMLERLIRVQDEERRRVARDIHDDPLQVMAGVNLRLEVVRHQVIGQPIENAVTVLQTAVQSAMERLRDLVFELHPPTLETHGLRAALEVLFERLRRDFGLRCELDDTLDAEPPVALRRQLFRAAREALINVAKHAQTQSAHVALAPDGRGIRLEVVDHGVGFPPGSTGRPDSLGLLALREATELKGGRLSVSSAAGGGTVFHMWMPIAEFHLD